MLTAHRRRRRFPTFGLLRATLGLLVLALVLVSLGLVAALQLIDPNRYKPEIEAAVRQATGRTLTLRGPLHFGFGLSPRLVAEDVTLSNPDGFSRPEMATVERAQARLALWPLLSGKIVLTDLTLIRPNIRLERDESGQPNWLLSPARAAESPAAMLVRAGPAAEHGPRSSEQLSGEVAGAMIAVGSVGIEDGRIGWLPRPGATAVDIAVPAIYADASGPNGTTRLSGTLVVAGHTLALSGEVGPLDRLVDRVTAAPWTVRLTLQDASARFAVEGSIAEPQRRRGMSLRLNASISDFAGLAPLLPADTPVPHDATLSAQLTDGGPTGVKLHVGHLLLPFLPRDVEISHADLAAPGLDGPVQAVIEGTSSAGPLQLVVAAADLGALLPGAHPAKPVPIDITLDAGRAQLAAKGTVAQPAELQGLELDVSAQVPDLAAFSKLFGRPLPALSHVVVAGHVSGDIGATSSIGIHHATLTLPQAQLSGDVDFRLGPRAGMRAVLSAPSLDLDALLPNLHAIWAAPLRPIGHAAAPVPAVVGQRRAIPDTPIDFSLLDRMDADVRLHVDALRMGGATYRQIDGAVTLHDGKLIVDRLVGTTQGGPAELGLSIDSRLPATPVSLHLRAPALPLAQLVAALGAPGAATGSLSVAADLQGAGRTPHAIAGSLNGQIVLGSVDSDFDNGLLIALLRLAKLPDVPLKPGGTTRLRCLAVKLDVGKGVATIGALVADLQHLVVMGGGSFDLGQEQFALRVRPLLRIGGAIGGIVVPVRVGGGFLDPKVASDPGSKGAPPITGSGAPDPCVPALAAVDGPLGVQLEPPPAIAVAKPEKRGTAAALDVLKRLLR